MSEQQTPYAAATTDLEVEVKFAVADLAAVAQRLEAAGAALVGPRVYEHNLRLEDAAGSLQARSMTLRLRQDRRVRLTLKSPVGPAATAVPGEAKVREELEVEVSELAQMQRILERLGFRPVFVYEKYRTTFRHGACEIVLDETPIGSFVEIEGPLSELASAANVLGLAWSERIVDSYYTLFERTRMRLQLAARNMTFAELEGTTVPAVVLKP